MNIAMKGRSQVENHVSGMIGIESVAESMSMTDRVIVSGNGRVSARIAGRIVIITVTMTAIATATTILTVVITLIVTSTLLMMTLTG